MVKRILTITTWILTAAALVALLGFARTVHYSLPVTGLELEIKQQQEGGFLSYNVVHKEITEMVGANRTKALGWTNIRALKTSLEQNPYVVKAEASSTLERKIKVQLTERKPVVRVFTLTDQSFYIGEDNVLFPTHPDFISRVIVANGNISSLPVPDNSALPLSKLINKKHSVFSVAKTAGAINKDPFMQVLIDQIFINEDETIELSPKIGDSPIYIGDTNYIAQKIFNVSAFFQARSNDPALHNYHTINASFKNQIVCTKRDSL